MALIEIAAKEIIDTADRRMPGNTYTLGDKVDWLKACRAMWRAFEREAGTLEPKVIDLEEKIDAIFKRDDPQDYYDVRVFGLPENHWEMYVVWIVMKMHYYNGEIELYNNSAEAFNRMFEEAKKESIRQNRSVREVKFTGHREV
jgi:hypothetical protein